MTRWIVATLAAPFASFGEDPGNVYRGSAETPTRSGLIGLAAATLGVQATDFERLRDLASSLKVATYSVLLGTPVVDLQTMHSLRSSEGMQATRADALSNKNELKTSLSYRTYRSDVLHFAAWRTTAESVVTLEALQSAFERPVFAPYLGRRSCPLSEPMRPRIVDRTNVLDVFKEYESDVSRHIGRQVDKREYAGIVSVEDLQDMPTGMSMRRRVRHDDPVGTSCRLFARRSEWSARLAPTDEEVA